MAYTRALIVVFWETPRRYAQLSATDLQAQGEVDIDDLRLAHLEPTPEQSIALQLAPQGVRVARRRARCSKGPCASAVRASPS